MAFDPKTRFFARVRLVDADLRPRPLVQLLVRAARGGLALPPATVTLGAGTTDDAGALRCLIDAKPLLAAELLPSLELIWSVGHGLRWLADSERMLVQGSDVEFDFGELVVFDAPLALSEQRTYFALPAALQGLVTATRVSAALEREGLERELAGERARVAELETALAAAKSTITKLSGADKAPTMNELVAGLGDQLQAADRSLAERGSTYRVGKVSLDLKVVSTPSVDGQLRFAAPTQTDAKAPVAISSMALEFVPKPVLVEPASALVAKSSARPLAEVPALIGDGESLARRRASEAGFGVKVMQRELSPEARDQAGRVVRQLPEPGAMVSPGSTLTLLIGQSLTPLATSTS